MQLMGIASLNPSYALEMTARLSLPLPAEHRFLVGSGGPHPNPPPQAGEGARIRVFITRMSKNVDARVKPGHDEENWVPVLRRTTSCCAAPGTRDQLSKKLRSFRDRDGR